MLNGASFANYKALRDVSVDLGPITALIGPNASGKSSVLDGVDLLSRLARIRTWDSRDILAPASLVFHGSWEPTNVRTAGARDPLCIALNSPVGSFALEWAEDPEHNWSATLSYPSAEHRIRLAPDGGRQFNQVLDFFRGLPQTLGSALRLSLVPSKLKAPSYSEEETPRVEHDGAGLASVIAYIRGVDEEKHKSIEHALREIVPAAGRIRTPRAQIVRKESIVLPDGNVATHERIVWGNSLEVEMPGAGYLPAELLSDGTVLALAIVTLLHEDSESRLILLDDIETGLHPRAQQQLILVLRRFLETNKELQFVIATHSPYLLDVLKDDEVYALRLDKHGHTRCRRLSAHPEWKRWRGKMELGEFWSTVGEDWLVDNEVK